MKFLRRPRLLFQSPFSSTSSHSPPKKMFQKFWVCRPGGNAVCDTPFTRPNTICKFIKCHSYRKHGTRRQWPDWWMPNWKTMAMQSSLSILGIGEWDTRECLCVVVVAARWNGRMTFGVASVSWVELMTDRRVGGLRAVWYWKSFQHLRGVDNI